MLMLIIVTVILTILFFQWTLKSIKNFKMINQIPGPPGLPIAGNALDLMVSAEEMWNNLRKMAREYYPTYRLWQFNYAAVSVLNPDDIEIVLSTTKHITKSRIYELLLPWLSTGLLTSTGSKWQQRRKILTPAFHFNILQQFLPIIIEQSEHLVKELEGECDKPYTNVVPFISYSTLNTICETAMGTRLDKKNENSRKYINAVFRLGELLIYRLLRPWYHYTIFYIWSATYREERKLLKVLHNFSKSVINNREKEFNESILKSNISEGQTKKKRLAMLDLLISAKREGQPIDYEGICEEVDTFIFEGHDTTAACLNFTLLALACHSDIQDKVVEELWEVFGDSNRQPTYNDLQNLRYMEQVIKESLRMFPSVPFISRYTDHEIQTSSGHKIPENTIIFLHIYDLHFTPDLYPNPEKFDPERFSPENTVNRHPFAYLPFSAGPRNCIGQKFALLEIKAVISAILRKFVLKPVDQPDDIKMIIHVILKARSEIRVKFEKREFKHNVM